MCELHDIAEVINTGEVRYEGMSNVTQCSGIPAAHRNPIAASVTTTAISRLRIPTTASVLAIRTKTSVTNSRHVDRDSSKVEIVELQQNARSQTVNSISKVKALVGNILSNIDYPGLNDFNERILTKYSLITGSWRAKKYVGFIITSICNKNGSTTKDIIPKRIIPKCTHQESAQVTK